MHNMNSWKNILHRKNIEENTTRKQTYLLQSGMIVVLSVISLSFKILYSVIGN